MFVSTINSPSPFTHFLIGSFTSLCLSLVLLSAYNTPCVCVCLYAGRWKLTSSYPLSTSFAHQRRRSLWQRHSFPSVAELPRPSQGPLETDRRVFGLPCIPEPCPRLVLLLGAAVDDVYVADDPGVRGDCVSSVPGKEKLISSTDRWVGALLGTHFVWTRVSKIKTW